jgi:hypothetical protein
LNTDHSANKEVEEMDLFSEIEGLSGEKLGSALLRNVIMNSQELRDSFLSLLSQKSPFGPITFISHFACRSEYRTESIKYGGGYIDLLIQVDDAVIGIENKFLAVFQNDQPHKYLETIEKVASSLKNINYSNVNPIVVVLCPEERVSEGNKSIHNLNNAIIITWEEVFLSFEKVKDISNPVTKIVLGELKKYYKKHFSFIPDYSKKYYHYRKKFYPKGSPIQRELVGKLWSLFPSHGPRMGTTDTYVGYGFYVKEKNNQGWYGFVSKDEIKNEISNESELIIVSTFEPQKLSNDFERVELKKKNFLWGYPDYKNAWIVKFDPNWNSIYKWMKKIAPFEEGVSVSAEMQD